MNCYSHTSLRAAGVFKTRVVDHFYLSTDTTLTWCTSPFPAMSASFSWGLGWPCIRLKSSWSCFMLQLAPLIPRFALSFVPELSQRLISRIIARSLREGLLLRSRPLSRTADVLWCIALCFKRAGLPVMQLVLYNIRLLRLPRIRSCVHLCRHIE